MRLGLCEVEPNVLWEPLLLAPARLEASDLDRWLLSAPLLRLLRSPVKQCPLQYYFRIWQDFAPKTWTWLVAKRLLVFVLQHIIRGNRPIKAEMAHQLYVLQVLTFNLLEERMMTKMDPNDQVKTHRTLNVLAVSSSRVEVLNNSF